MSLSSLGEVSHLLFEFRQNFMHIFSASQAVHDFQFGKLDINRVIVFAEKYLDFVLKDSWPALNDQQDIPQSNVLDLGAGRQQGH
jgi:hypothetical protein